MRMLDALGMRFCRYPLQNLDIENTRLNLSHLGLCEM